MVSFLTHIIIIGIAVYGLPNFGRKLPPDLTVISFELLKVVEETNLDLAVKINPEKNIEIKENVAKQDENTVDETKKQITTSRQSEEINLPSQKSDILISPNKKPSIPISPSRIADTSALVNPRTLRDARSLAFSDKEIRALL